MSSSTNNDRAAWLEGRFAECSPAPQVPHPWRLILLGAPGVGKGTQAELLHKSLGACHLSTGDVFRAAKNQAACALSAAMADALTFMRKGALVSDSTVWDIVRERGLCLKLSRRLHPRWLPPYTFPGRRLAWTHGARESTAQRGNQP